MASSIKASLHIFSPKRSPQSWGQCLNFRACKAVVFEDFVWMQLCEANGQV